MYKNLNHVSFVGSKVEIKIDNDVMVPPVYVEFRSIDTITINLILERLFTISQSYN